MLIYTCEGPRSVDDRDVIAVHRGERCGRWWQVTVVLHYGAEISGLIHIEALAKLEAMADEAA